MRAAQEDQRIPDRDCRQAENRNTVLGSISPRNGIFIDGNGGNQKTVGCRAHKASRGVNKYTCAIRSPHVKSSRWFTLDTMNHTAMQRAARHDTQRSFKSLNHVTFFCLKSRFFSNQDCFFFCGVSRVWEKTLFSKKKKKKKEGGGGTRTTQQPPLLPEDVIQNYVHVTCVPGKEKTCEPSPAVSLVDKNIAINCQRTTTGQGWLATGT